MLKPDFLMDSILTQIALPAFGFCFRRSRFLVGGRRWVPNQKVEEVKAETFAALSGQLGLSLPPKPLLSLVSFWLGGLRCSSS